MDDLVGYIAVVLGNELAADGAVPLVRMDDPVFEEARLAVRSEFSGGKSYEQREHRAERGRDGLWKAHARREASGAHMDVFII
jgi:hypothetical protein